MRDEGDSSPQLEDGFTRIANELLEALLLARLTSRQYSVVLALARKTYGFNKKVDDIGLSQLADLTGLAKPHLSVAVRELEERLIISRVQGKYAHVMGINKEYKCWLPSIKDREKDGEACRLEHAANLENTETVTVTESVKKGYRIGKTGVTESVTTKDKPTKERQKKAPRDEVTFNEWINRCAFEKIAPIPEDDGVFVYADAVGLTTEFVRFAWVEFKRKYAGGTKRYKQWEKTFQNAVRENWYGLWFEKDGEWHLTTRGKQVEKELRG